MSSFPVVFSSQTESLSAAGLGEYAAEAVTYLEEKGYKIITGLTVEYLEQIQALAAEPAMREYTPKDLGERFGSEAAAAKWLEKGRAMYILLKDTGNDTAALAGYGWAGAGNSEKIPDGRHTFAIRLGQIAQGQGLAAPFSWLIIADSAAHYEARDFWLETWQSNGAAVHTYHKIGFNDVTSEQTERPSAAGDSVTDTRLFMRLPNNRLPV